MTRQIYKYPVGVKQLKNGFKKQRNRGILISEMKSEIKNECSLFVNQYFFREQITTNDSQQPVPASETKRGSAVNSQRSAFSSHQSAV